MRLFPGQRPKLHDGDEASQVVDLHSLVVAVHHTWQHTEQRHSQHREIKSVTKDAEQRHSRHPVPNQRAAEYTILNCLS